MKKLITIVYIFLFVTVINAQQQQPIFANNPFPRTITVSGSSEMEIIPDEIYVNVELKEYQKKGDDKKDIEAIKTSFLEACKSAEIPDSAISIAAYSGYNPYTWKKRKKDPNLFSGITYQVKFKNSEMMDKLVEKLDDDATQSFLIVSTSHSKITEYRRQLKIAAVKAAKEKGIYLTEAVGEKLGEAITIKEPDEFGLLNSYSGENSQIRIRGVNSIGLSNNLSYSYDKTGESVDFKKLKLRFEVEVVFSLK